MDSKPSRSGHTHFYGKGMGLMIVLKQNSYQELYGNSERPIVLQGQGFPIENLIIILSSMT